MNIVKKLSQSELKELNKLKKFFVSVIKKDYSNFNGDLSALHKIIRAQNINEIRLKIFNEINKKYNWKKLLKNIAINELEKIHGQDLIIQSKINLSIQMPHDHKSVLPLHTDTASADSPFQTNLWIPLTKCFDTNSMFIYNKTESMKIYDKIIKNKKINLIKKKIPSNKFINLDYGQILFFNPALFHGNTINKTSDTRVSLNVRIKSLFSPEPDNNNPDRRIGTYYKIFSISEKTKFGIELIKKNYFK